MLVKNRIEKTLQKRLSVTWNWSEDTVFFCSVADPGCLSPILIFTHPGSRIQKQQQKRGVKKN
jgi:hypothetical protein